MYAVVARRTAKILFVALPLAALVWALRPLAPPPVPRPVVPYAEGAALARYAVWPIHDLVGFLARHDRSGDGVVDAAEAGDVLALHADTRSILSPSQRLAALDALAPALARQLLAVRAGAELAEIARGGDPRPAYWRMDPGMQHLARRLGAIAPAALRAIDGGGARRVHGGEDLPPVMPFSPETVRAYPVPWPSGNLAVAEVGGHLRVFVTPFPDANFTDTQLHELDLVTGALRAYPPGRPDLQRALRTTLGIEAHGGRLYALDHGAYGIRQARIVAIELARDEVVLDHAFPIALGQMPNDLAFVDEPDRLRIFVSDTAPGRTPSGAFNAKSGILELDVRGDRDLRVASITRHLDGDPLVEDGGLSMYPDRDRPARSWLGAHAWGGVDGIAARGREIYFRRMQRPEIMVAPADALDAAHARLLDRFPFIDGFHIDDRDLLWYGDVETGSVFVYDLLTGVTVKVVQDDSLRWLDEVNVHGEQAFVTTSHLHEYMHELLPWRRKRAIAAAAPFALHVLDLRPALATVLRLRAELGR